MAATSPPRRYPLHLQITTLFLLLILLLGGVLSIYHYRSAAAVR